MGSLANYIVKRVTRRRARAMYQDEFDIDAWRAFLARLGARARLPRGMERVEVDESGIRGIWFHPKQRRARAGCLLYVHGGGYVGGEVADYAELIARIARAAEMSTFACEYRTAPEHPYPAAADDLRAAYDWLAAEHAPLYLAGDSAGGGLALGLLLALRDEGRPLPEAAVLLSPITDLTLSGASVEEQAAVDPLLSREALAAFARHYLDGHDPADPAVSPLFAELSGLPPLLVQVGSEEVLLDDSRRFVEAARAAGVPVEYSEWTPMMHDFHFTAWLLPIARRAIREIGAFLKDPGEQRSFVSDHAPSSVLGHE